MRRMRWVAGLFLTMAAAAASATGTAFTYQGELRNSGASDANYDFEVVLFADASGVTPLAGPFDFNDVVLDNGRFLLTIDPGNTVFTGPDRWLELRVRRGSDTGSYQQLLPRQKLLATPYAQHADDANFAASIADGSVTTAKLGPNAVNAARVDAAQVQLRVGACGAGQVMVSVNADGSANCTPLPVGDITDVTASTGLSGGGTSGSVLLAVDPAVVQSRVAGTCSAGSAIRVVNQDGSVSCEAIPAAPTDYWSRGGNAGTTPATNFLGTTDNQAFELRVNNTRALRVEPALGASPNLIAGSPANGPTAAGLYGVTIAGGGDSVVPNTVSGSYGTVSGGVHNTAAAVGVVGGGADNAASGAYSVVAGGVSNAASADFSMVPGGKDNCAGAPYSFAGGRLAKVHPPSDPGAGPCSWLTAYPGGNGDAGSFVWADSTGTSLSSTGPNQFVVRAAGGAWFYSNAGMTTGVRLLPGAGTWTIQSDRNAKTDIAAIDASDVLARVLALPLYTWRYRTQEVGIRHLGPMAQDFHAAFGLNGEDDKGIATVDPDGVALAAIQGVYREFDARGKIAETRLDDVEARAGADAKRIAQLETDNAALRAELAALTQRLRALEAAANHDGQSPR